jgi:stage II sporulation protein D
MIAGDDFRAAVGPRELRSTAFTVTKAGRAYRFTGRGYGHGVGMCVVGAGRRAARGETTAQILAQYYPGLTLTPDSSSRGPAPASGSASASGSTPPWALNPSWERASPGPESNIVTRAPADLDRSLVSRVALAARDELAATLGVIPPPGMTIEIFDSIDAFRQATGRPWWTTTVVEAKAILLPPPSVLAQRDGLEAAVRRGLIEMLTADVLADRPAWVRVGAARYFARRERPDAAAPVTCPTDAELTLAIAATVQREAERRAEACFARALARKREWRAIP